MLSQSDEPSLGLCLREYHSVSNPVLLTVLIIILGTLSSACMGLASYTKLGLPLTFDVLATLLAGIVWIGIGHKVAIHQHGVRLASRQSERRVRWEEIMEVRAVCRAVDSADGWRIDRIELRLEHEDKPLVLERVRDRNKELLRSLQNGTKQPLLKRYKAKIQAGESIIFAGSLNLTPAGVRQDNSFVPWSEVGQVAAQPFHLILYRPNRTLAMWIDTANMPNAHLLAPVLDFHKVWGVNHSGSSAEVAHSWE